MQLGILIGGAWNRAASVASAVNAFKATGIFPLDQTVIPDHLFSICDAAETGKATEPGSSKFPVNNLSEHSSSANSGAPHHIKHSKPPLTPSKMLCNISPLPHIPVKKTTKKQEATVLMSSEFTGNKQLKKSKAERGKRKMEQGLSNSSTNKKKKQRLSLQKTAGNPEVNSHSCADVGKTVTKQQG
jgi:hypothetical protein